jgi:toluene monooxygenase system ferredoxin subunit
MPARDETWQVVMPADDLWEGELTGGPAGREEHCPAQRRGRDPGLRGPLPHLGFQLSQGDLDGCTLTCANHQWEFDALTGQGTNPGNCRLTVFGTRVRAGQIEILAPGPD